MMDKEMRGEENGKIRGRGGREKTKHETAYRHCEP
jgi:hypothetical protein